MANNKDFEILLKHIQNGLKEYSLSDLNDVLSSALNTNKYMATEIEHVFLLVKQKFKINASQLKEKHVRGKIVDAKRITYCLLYYDLKIPVRYISKYIFNNWENSVYIGIKKLENCDNRIKQDKEFMEAYKDLQAKLIQHNNSKTITE